MKTFASRLRGVSGRSCFLALFSLLCQSTTLPGTTDIRGTVRNESRGLPAFGEEVLLVRLDQDLKDEGHVRTDANGEFTLHAQNLGRPYLVRVMHAGVPYDRRASPGDSLSIQVFDAAPKVGGITGSIEILRAGTEGAFLHVSDMFEVTNASSPPMTQAGKRTFEVYLPADARIDSILAAGPEKVATMLSASPVPREPGHYLLNFPLRPGTTKFAFNYNLPYRGRAVFQTRLAYPLGQLAVMLSPSMRFSSPSSAFVLLATGNSDYQVHATNQLKAGQGPLFVISGVGAFPSLGGQAKSQALSQPWFSAEPTEAIVRPASPASRTSAGPLLRPTPSYTRPSSPSSVLIVLSAVLFAASGLWIWRVRRTLPTGGYGTAFGSSQRRPITTVSSPPLREKCTNR